MKSIWNELHLGLDVHRCGKSWDQATIATLT